MLHLQSAPLVRIGLAVFVCLVFCASCTVAADGSQPAAEATTSTPDTIGGDLDELSVDAELPREDPAGSPEETEEGSADDEGSAEEAGADSGATTTTLPMPDLAAVRVELEPVSRDLDRPIALVGRSGEPLSVYVAERGGLVHRLEIRDDRRRARDFELATEPFLDISAEVSTSGERGLLDIVFSSDGQTLYLSYSDRTGTSVIEQVRLAPSPAGQPILDLTTRRVLLRQSQPADNHNGGALAFGPDGFLYVAFGDGGGSGDPNRSAQDPTSLLGSIIRIDPERASGLDRYGIPGSNPYTDPTVGAPEVWLHGVRNPWRFSFDSRTGDLWIADVGQAKFEEINFLPAAAGGGKGANLGWSLREGDEPFNEGEVPPDLVEPVFVYPHDQGRCSVTGGRVYRGDRVPSLNGLYVYGDFCQAELRVLAVRPSDGAMAERSLGIGVGSSLVSFGEDTEGDLYALSLERGAVYRLGPG